MKKDTNKNIHLQGELASEITSKSSQDTDFVRLFRSSAPYVNAHRGRTFVLYLDGQLMASKRLPRVLSDVALLSSLGVRLLLVTGADVEIDQALKAAGLPANKIAGLRLTDADTLATVEQVVGQQRIKLEGYFSVGLANTPAHQGNQQIVSGNYVIGRRLGVVNGQDYALTGAVRRLDRSKIHQHLDSGALVHLTCLGYSVTGEAFNLRSEEIAVSAAALGADKLIFLTKSLALKADDEVISEFGLNELLAFGEASGVVAGSVQDVYIQAINQAIQAGIRRCHVLDYEIDGALLRELFLHYGSGTQISMRRGDQARSATLEDIGGILAMIKPLEQAGVLVQRDRSLLEQEIDQFRVMEMDGLITGCAALYPLAGTDMGELACLATHSDYRRRGEGEALLQAIERDAKAAGLKTLFVLTTQTADWFADHGFAPRELSDLPSKRQKFYNFQRGAKVLVKALL